MSSLSEINRNLVDRLSAAPGPALRAAISRLALLTPGAQYGSGDLNPEGDEGSCMRGLTVALTLIASEGCGKITDASVLDFDFNGLTAGDEPYGDWRVSIGRKDIGAEVDVDALVDGEYGLSKLDAEDIRKALSELSGMTPRTIYTNANMGSALQSKVDETGREMGIASQGAMFVCGELRQYMRPGETRKIAYDGLIHGLRDVTRWTVTVTRVSEN